MAVDAQECPFCEIVQRDDPYAREVYRDEQVVAFFPTEPAVLGHTMIIPRQHVPDIWSLDEATAGHLARATVRLAGAVREAVQPEGLNIIQSNGEAASQTVLHLHVHLVPRRQGDAMGPIWPDETDHSESEKDAALERLRTACRAVQNHWSNADLNGGGSPSVDGEDRRKHLDFIQAVVTRMSAASSQAKAWLLPVVTAAYGYALTQQADSVAWLGVMATILFAYLDANYLRQEKRFRSLYKAVASGTASIAAFSLQPDDLPRETPRAERGDWPEGMWSWVNRLLPGPKVWASWSISLFYGPVILGGILIACKVA